MKILITAVKRQPKITLRNKTILKENNFNFGSIIYFESWAERLASKRYVPLRDPKKQHRNLEKVN